MSRRIAIFTDDPGWHGARLQEAIEAHGCSSEFVSLQQCGFEINGEGRGLRIAGFDTLPDGAFVRGVPGGSLEQVVHYLDILHALKHLGVCVYNDARAIERSVDKGMTSFLLHDAGIPTPPTWVLGEQDPTQILMQEFSAGHELVVKPLFGSQGNGLLRIADGDSLPAQALYNGIYYLQRFISTGSEDAHDWRVFVINGRAVATMLRRGRGWISNVAQGARCHPAVLEKELRELAEAAADVLEMNYAGVDILRDDRGRPYVIEVNSIPAWRGLQRVTHLDLTWMLVDDFLSCTHFTPLTEVI
ncbi:MAG: RimK family alpha-L-glutamate ligase [gamma proteobacterium symbiont of Ctena orbiculata]|nr:RimK family alpha-L-glutamate ligase [Candidatus Thiodiazotropha taylori]MBT3058442.1 RimK family alpha-L-glutamate ligase [Candidatus Thiodiazotropha sp. (ex Lucina pensylvanica)]MBV2094960.1 RimK family alpha-L-glutamate ligase [Candidatus Thiodiazotropha sp. (ex Codakia orbicularis)]PUB74734.1 MAG: alpha-L-glutamate ligase [gamma proteobacterium symbiont of Ctena orbiculata]MBT3061495.1 RimK family alpha-L-glutamate ligase [Candidatus Thiodiazotropha sp. (ex Lucina pensylvanica)]